MICDSGGHRATAATVAAARTPGAAAGVNPHAVNGGGREIAPQTTLFAAISEPLGISGRAFATFPEYDLATRQRFQIIVTFQKSNMAAGKPEML